MKTPNPFPPRSVVELLRHEYPAGTRVELVNMDDPYNRKLKPGDRGTVSIIDDTGTIFVNWDCGSSLGIVYGVDCVKKI